MNAAAWPRGWVLAGFLAGSSVAAAQAPPPVQTSEAARDEALNAATAMIGRATILRGFPGAAELHYDAAGRLQGQPGPVDWTLAGVEVQKVVRRADGAFQMDGVRVAIRYNPEQHTFERHALKETRVKMELAAGDARAALAAMVSVGIDPALQRSMPPHWLHYFIPGAEWAADDLAGQAVVPANARPAAGRESPVLIQKTEAEFTPEAVKDRVKGTVQLRLVVGADGVPRRIAIRQPLGYGLDQRAVEAAAKYRFQPATQDGKPVAMEVIVNQTFDLPPPPR